MEKLIVLFKEDFESQPLKIKEKYDPPCERVLSNGCKITTCSNGKYLFDGTEYNGIRNFKAALKSKYKKDYKQISKEVPNAKSFTINAGYKWFNRRDLHENDCMKELGTRVQLLFGKLILQDGNWKILSADGLSREPDLLFINELLKLILYYEVKLCLNLDTTNGPGNIEKIDLISQELQNKYQDMKIISGLFCPSLLNAAKIKDVAPQLASGNPAFKDRLIYGFNSLMETLKLPLLNDTDFVKLGQSLGKELKAK